MDIIIPFPARQGLSAEEYTRLVDREIAERDPQPGDRVVLGETLILEHPDFYVSADR